MAALSADTNRPHREGKQVRYEVAEAQTIFKGALVCVDTASGYLKEATDGAARAFAGVAAEGADNGGGGDGDVTCLVAKTGVYPLVFPAADQGVVGLPVYAVDDQTVALAAATTNDVLVGYVVGLADPAADGGHVWVRIDNAVK